MISEDKLTSMIAWFEADGPKPNGAKVTRADMAQALRELQATRDAKHIDNHCADCCCARSWKALAITEYTGKSIPEHISDLKGRLNLINETVYAAGAPLGSENYFKIRQLAVGATCGLCRDKFAGMLGQDLVRKEDYDALLAAYRSRCWRGGECFPNDASADDGQ